MRLDLLLRYLIISIAMQLACAWIQTFQSPWPLADAFELAENAEEQLFQSLGVSFKSLILWRVFHAGPRALNVLYASVCVLLRVVRSGIASLPACAGGVLASRAPLRPRAVPTAPAGPWCPWLAS